MMSREQVLTRLAKNHFIIHSTPPADRHTKAPAGGMMKIQENLYHYSNPWFLPRLYRSGAAEALMNRLRRAHRRSKLKQRAGKETPIIYLWHPSFVGELDHYRDSLVIYHIYDDYANFPGASAELARQERKALERADIVFVANARLLEERKRTFDRDYVHLPQGVDFDIFENARTSKKPPPNDIASIPNPRIGYIGRINEKVDLKLVEELLQARPEWNFVFVGPYNSSGKTANQLAKLDAFENIHLLGPKPFQEIAAYWDQLDVAIIPYQHVAGQWAFFGSPLKLREAFAAGKPVVASPLDDIESFGALAHTARHADEWLQMIEQSIEQGSDTEARNARINYAKNNSWNARASEIETAIQEILVRD